MAKPLQTGKKTVNLAAPGVRESRIRRDPPSAVKELVVRDRDEHDRRMVVIGVVSFAIALFIIAVGFIGTMGWSPRQYTIHYESKS